MWDAFLAAFDPTGPDFFTLLIAAAVSFSIAVFRYLKGREPYITTGRCIRDFLNAGALLPFTLLFLSVGSSKIFDHLKASRLALGLAGFVGFIFVVGELYRSYTSTAP